MSGMFSPNFVAVAKIIFRYDFVAPLLTIIRDVNYNKGFQLMKDISKYFCYSNDT